MPNTLISAVHHLFADFHLRKPILATVLLLILTVVGLFTSGQIIPLVQAAHGGIVCLTDPGNLVTVGTTACNNVPAGGNQTFTGMSVTEVAATTPGGQTQLRVAVEITNSTAINAFDITVRADHTKLQPFDADITGTILSTITGATVQVLAKCIAGIPRVGPVCDPATDSLDTVRLAAVAQGGAGITTAPTYGVLFTAIFNIVGDSATPIPVGFQTGCGTRANPTSTPPFCITIENGGTLAIPEGAMSATYVTGAAATVPWFALQPATGAVTSFNLIAGQTLTNANDIAANVGNGFTCGGIACIDYSTLVPNVPGLSASLSPTTSTESAASGTGVTSLTIITSAQTPVDTYTIFAVGRPDTTATPMAPGTTFIGSELTFTVTIRNLAVTPAQSAFIIQRPSTGANLATDQVKYTNLGSFAITVFPSVTVSNGFPAATLNSTLAFSLAAGASHNKTLTFGPASTTAVGNFNVTAGGYVNGVLSASLISVQVTDFTMSASPTSLTISAGSSGTSTITLTGQNGFTGSVNLAMSTPPSGVLTMFVPNPVRLTAISPTGTSMLNISVNSSVAPTTFTLTVTGTSSSLSHPLTITVTVTAFVGPTFTLHWVHHLTLAKFTAGQPWHGTVTNPLTTNIAVVFRITGGSVTNPALTFDVTCGTNGCFNTVGTPATTPGVTFISVTAGGSTSFSFNQAFSSAFLPKSKVSFTATLYFGAASPTQPSMPTKSGAFAVVP